MNLLSALLFWADRLTAGVLIISPLFTLATKMASMSPLSGAKLPQLRWLLTPGMLSRLDMCLGTPTQVINLIDSMHSWNVPWARLDPGWDPHREITPEQTPILSRRWLKNSIIYIIDWVIDNFTLSCNRGAGQTPVPVFNPRPLRLKGYYRHLRLSVCPSVCLSVPIILVNTITQSVYPISPPNLLSGFNMALPWMVL